MAHCEAEHTPRIIAHPALKNGNVSATTRTTSINAPVQHQREQHVGYAKVLVTAFSYSSLRGMVDELPTVAEEAKQVQVHHASIPKWGIALLKDTIA